MTNTIGIIGLTPLSIAFATKLYQAGLRIIAFDNDKAIREAFTIGNTRVAAYVDEFFDAIDTKRVVWSFLNDGKELDLFLENYISYFAVSDILIDCSHSTPHELGARLRYAQGYQIDLMDAVLVHSDPTLKLWIGGNRFAYNYCIPILKKAFDEPNYHYTGLCGDARRQFSQES
ncbi:NAD(P)-binding domain-containing protein [Pseudochryseolinea flava]|uniref:6-phosphogluconate dehydrogenase NADP-binding domain-containing protein n=1 Tax=Pseudochryseolinea flava TaxID=2059302 RepID=A0A364Y3Y1_9BACT|nr:NAD(P)-binding domain-containing protein [Pseudochryseolinea flava]RAW01632.1 hypothetical protein DQQ10_08225 [Pseudochryseolinea flava]